MPRQIQWDLTKTLFKEKFITLRIFTNKQEILKISTQLKKPEKEQNKPEECRSKELIRMKVDVNELVL